MVYLFQIAHSMANAGSGVHDRFDSIGVLASTYNKNKVAHLPPVSVTVLCCGTVPGYR